MQLKIEATLHPEGTKVTDIKVPGRELQMLIQNARGTTLGRVTLSRVERLNTTLLTAEAQGGTLESMLEIDGLPDDVVQRLRKKRFATSIQKKQADFHIRPGDALFFLDLNEKRPRKYTDLHVMLG